MKIIGTILLLLAVAQCAPGQEFSYIYLQGDKKTPFYVKREGVMMPRYGKNYCILSELSPGPITFEVLFQQNVYPPQKFTIVVAPHGHREVMLDRKNNHFVLYDLQKKRYLGADEH